MYMYTYIYTVCICLCINIYTQYVYVYVYIYSMYMDMYMYTYIYTVCKCLCIYIYTVCICISKYIYIHTQYVYVYVYIYTVCICICKYIYTVCICVYIYTVCICICIHIYIIIYKYINITSQWVSPHKLIGCTLYAPRSRQFFPTSQWRCALRLHKFRLVQPAAPRPAGQQLQGMARGPPLECINSLEIQWLDLQVDNCIHIWSIDISSIFFISYLYIYNIYNYRTL